MGSDQSMEFIKLICTADFVLTRSRFSNDKVHISLIMTKPEPVLSLAFIASSFRVNEEN